MAGTGYGLPTEELPGGRRVSMQQGAALGLSLTLSLLKSKEKRES